MYQVVFSTEFGTGYSKECNEMNEQVINELKEHVERGFIVAFAKDQELLEEKLNLKPAFKKDEKNS